MDLEKTFPFLEKEVDLKNYSTFMIGGKAKHFLLLEKGEDIKKAIEISLKNNIPFYILGFGSNTLICNNYFDGLVIVYKSKNPDLEIKENIIKADASIPLHFLIAEAKYNGLAGLEWAIGIPGTLGGAINGNAGAFNESISDSVESVYILEIVGKEIKERTFSKQECEFDYRNSIFKKNDNLIILSVLLKLEKKDQKEIEEKIKINLEKRKYNPKGFSVGSIFKNYLDQEKNEFVSAGKIVEQCGLKGKRIGDAQISNEHANFIINLGSARSEDVLELINLIKKEAEKQFSIKLEEEIKFFNCKNSKIR